MDAQIEVVWEGTSARVSVSGELTIYQVATARQSLIEPLTRARTLCVDIGGITDLDTAGFQLLLSLLTECTARGVPLELIGTSGALSEIVDLFRFPLVEEPRIRAA